MTELCAKSFREDLKNMIDKSCYSSGYPEDQLAHFQPSAINQKIWLYNLFKRYHLQTPYNIENLIDNYVGVERRELIQQYIITYIGRIKCPIHDTFNNECLSCCHCDTITFLQCPRYFIDNEPFDQWNVRMIHSTENETKSTLIKAKSMEDMLKLISSDFYQYIFL